MKKLHLTTVITQEGKWFVARAIDLDVVSQGRTIEEAEKNLREAVELYLEDEPLPAQFRAGHAPHVTSLEVEYA